MFRFDFMSSDVTNKEEYYIDKVKKKYEIKLNKNDSQKERDYFLEEYLSKCVKKIDWEKEWKRLSTQMEFSGEEDRKQLDIVLNELKLICEESSNYTRDLNAMLYMASVYQDSDMIDTTSEMRTVWECKSNQDKINKEITKCYYPIEGYEFSNDEKRRCALTEINSGFLEFHKLMISKSNIGIFDIDTDIEDFRRYSVVRMQKIYEELRKSTIQDLLLMEYSLGNGYVNHVYDYIRDVTTFQELEEYFILVTTGAEIPAFFLRKKIVEILLHYIRMGEKNKRIHNAEIILSNIKENLFPIIKDILELCWYELRLNFSIQRVCDIQMKVASGLSTYFTENAYEDFLNDIGCFKWNKIKKVEDCFAHIANFSFSEKQYEGKGLKFDDILNVRCFPVKDWQGKTQTLIVEKPLNNLGDKILEELQFQLEKGKFPNCINETYELYYRIREDIFKDIYEKQQNMILKKDVKIRRNMKKVTPAHIYAALQYEVINMLLRVR